MKKAYLIILTLFSLYFVIGGIATIIIVEKVELSQEAAVDPTFGIDGEEYRNIKEQEVSEDYERLMTFYPVYHFLGNTLSYIITLMSFGMLGAIIRIILIGIHDEEAFKDLKIYSIPILGALVGLLMIVLSHIIPEFKYQSGNQKAYYLLALVGGMYSMEIFSWLREKFFNLIKK